MEINLTNPSAALFDEVAEEWARRLAFPQGERSEQLNKPTQLRRFYDELERWDTRITQHPDQFEAALPLIRMLNAKVAYARGRKLVDEQFSTLVRDCLRQVECTQSLHNMKLFFEALMGFLKLHHPKD